MEPAQHIESLCYVVRHRVHALPGVRMLQTPHDSGRYRPCVWLLLIDKERDPHREIPSTEDITELVIDPDSLVTLFRFAARGEFVDRVFDIVDRCVDNTRSERAAAEKRALLFPQWSPYP